MPGEITTMALGRSIRVHQPKAASLDAGRGPAPPGRIPTRRPSPARRPGRAGRRAYPKQPPAHHGGKRRGCRGRVDQGDIGGAQGPAAPNTVLDMAHDDVVERSAERARTSWFGYSGVRRT